MSPRVELARRVLESLAEGNRVSTRDAFQLRFWAPRPEDSMLTLEEIALSILSGERIAAPGSDATTEWEVIRISVQRRGGGLVALAAGAPARA